MFRQCFRPSNASSLFERPLRATQESPKALYSGITVNDQSLIPGDNPRIGPTHFEEWLRRNA